MVELGFERATPGSAVRRANICAMKPSQSGYHIRPNYRNVRLGFSNILGKLVVKYVPTYTKGTLKKKRSAKDSSNNAYAMFLSFFCFLLFLYENVCCWYSFELHRSVDAIQMGNHNICLYKEVDKKYTGCNLKTTELFACVLIGVYAVIRLNLVCLSCFCVLFTNICTKIKLTTKSWSDLCNFYSKVIFWNSCLKKYFLLFFAELE